MQAGLEGIRVHFSTNFTFDQNALLRIYAHLNIPKKRETFRFRRAVRKNELSFPVWHARVDWPKHTHFICCFCAKIDFVENGFCEVESVLYFSVRFCRFLVIRVFLCEVLVLNGRVASDWPN